jgi:hypothetical protein
MSICRLGVGQVCGRFTRGDLDGEPRADASFRFDVECSIDRCDSLSHSDKSEPAAADLHLGETVSVVFDRENHGSLPARQA